MITALCFGFIAIYLPSKTYDFERLHIFLFNLCTGGTILLHLTSGGGKLHGNGPDVFYLLSGVCLSAFFKWYPLTLVMSVCLFSLVEKSGSALSVFPSVFFKPGKPVAEKFHHASLLCLSIGIVIASLVILNNEYLHW